MKKLFVVMVAALAVFSSSAQIRTSRTFTKAKSNTEWILRAGLSINSFSGVDGINSKIGFDVDAAFNKAIGGSGLYWGMEFGIGTRGFGSDVEIDGDEVSITSYNVKWSPFTIGYKFNIFDSFRIDPHVGAFALYDFAKSSPVDAEYENDFDAGVQAGLGLWYKRVNLDFMYQFGFVEAFDEGGKTGNFLIRIGYSF